MRAGGVSAHAGLFPHPPGHWRRRPGAQRTGNSRRHFPRQQARAGLRPLWNGGGGGARHRTHPRRLDHRQFQLALDLLHQSAGRLAVALFDPPHGRGSTLPERGTEKNRPRGFHGPGADIHRRRLSGIRAGQGPGKGLVWRSEHHRICHHRGRFAVGVCLVGMAARRPHCRSQAAEEPQFRHRRLPPVCAGHGAVWNHGPDPAVSPGAAGVYRRARGHGSVSRGAGADADHALSRTELSAPTSSIRACWSRSAMPSQRPASSTSPAWI